MNQYAPSEPSRFGGFFKTLIVLAFIGAGVFAAITVKNRTAQREKDKQVIEELTKARRDMTSEMKTELEREGAVSQKTAAKAMKVFQSKLDSPVTAGGEGDRTLQAASEVLSELQSIAAPYMALLKRAETERPMDMSTVKEMRDLTARKEFGRQMLRMNGDLLAFHDTAEKRLRTKLEHAGITGLAAEEFVVGFMKGFNKSTAIQRRIWTSDKTLVTSLIAMADLLELKWGKWKMQNQTVVFSDVAMTARYDALMEATRKAAGDQAAAQRELLELRQRK